MHLGSTIRLYISCECSNYVRQRQKWHGISQKTSLQKGDKMVPKRWERGGARLPHKSPYHCGWTQISTYPSRLLGYENWPSASVCFGLQALQASSEWNMSLCHMLQSFMQSACISLWHAWRMCCDRLCFKRMLSTAYIWAPLVSPQCKLLLLHIPPRPYIMLNTWTESSSVNVGPRVGIWSIFTWYEFWTNFAFQTPLKCLREVWGWSGFRFTCFLKKCLQYGHVPYQA